MLRIVFLCCLAAACCGCGATRHLPHGSELLGSYSVETDPEVPRSERITATEVDKFIKQSPNRKVLGTNFYVWVYNLSDPQKDNWFHRLARRIGQEPVLYDSLLADGSAENIRLYLKSRGYYDARVDWEAHRSRRPRVKVRYRIDQNRPYRIDGFSYDFRDLFLADLVRRDSTSCLIRPGEVLDIGMLDRERTRVAEYLKNRGYYDFSVSNIAYEIDTITCAPYRARVKMIVKQVVTGYDAKGVPVMANNPVYRLGEIFLLPDYQPVVAASDSMWRTRLDTLRFEGLNIVADKRLRVRPAVLRRLVPLYPGYRYSAEQVQRVYDNLMRVGYYKSSSILFEEGDRDDDRFVTYVGNRGEVPAGERIQTREGVLTCNILCTPALRQGYKIELEASTTSNFYGLKATIGYQNRNLFRGMEQFDVSFTGGYEFLRAKGKKNSFEIGGATSLSLPRILFPFGVNRLNRLYNPRTRFELSVSSQRRPYYHRTLSGINFGYSWSYGRYGTYTLRPVDVSLVKMSYIDPDFLESLNNPYLRNSYQPQLIAGISGGYVYNRMWRNNNSLVFRMNAETTGNLIDGLTHLFTSDRHRDYYKLFGIRYSQYFRVDASLANTIGIGEKTAFAYRFFVGGGLSYGNSTSIPVDKLFFAGGVNSMRGWMVRTLGPGSSLAPTDVTYPSQLGNFRLEANVEFRFPIWSSLRGAVFTDVGNIWFLQSEGNDPDAVFRFDSFYKQLGFDAGLGLRLDLKFVVIRLDWGMRIHDPNQPIGKRWIHCFSFDNSALNLGIGYPF